MSAVKLNIHGGAGEKSMHVLAVCLSTSSMTSRRIVRFWTEPRRNLASEARCRGTSHQPWDKEEQDFHSSKAVSFRLLTQHLFDHKNSAFPTKFELGDEGEDCEWI